MGALRTITLLHARKHALVPVPVARPARPRLPASSRSSDSDARKDSPLPHASIPALPVAPARPSISERLLSLAHSCPRSPTARPTRQHAVGPAGSKEGASPSCAPITDRSARHQLREIKSSRRHLSPSHHHQHSPKRPRGHSPAPSLERSPTHSYARSPARSRAYPPARHSPARSHARAPAHARHHSQPYDRLSPTRECSPTGRSPTRYRATSPRARNCFHKLSRARHCSRPCGSYGAQEFSAGCFSWEAFPGFTSAQEEDNGRTRKIGREV
ncbi:CLK4-associating serine/arginine rich protein-like [Palaemon carinicauda]|uniref:CLK4-associating serine/arginine rich protein-like n=1 Tax=Palaemon carinicauda TaxID=392227 RepID=UPI0035B59790